MASTGSSSSASSPEPAPAGEVVVGVPTYNHARTAGAIGSALGAVLAEVGPGRVQVVIADGGSDDGTLQRIRQEVGGADGIVDVSYAVQQSDVLDAPYHGLPGRARALRAILDVAHARQAQACVLLDAGLSPAQSIAHLVGTAAEGHLDFIAPAYARHPFSGALLHGVVSPLFRALYGLRLRYPAGTDLACSARLIEAVLIDPIWHQERGQIGIDLWLAATAATGGFRVGQVVLPPRARDDRDAPDLGTTISQLVGFQFTDMERRVPQWQRVRGSRPVPTEGPSALIPPGPEVDPAPLVESFRLGWRELQEVWAEVMPPLSILQWRRLAAAPLEAFRVEDALWARTVYDFAMGHRLRVIARDHLLRSLTPLYLAWLASFVLELRHAPPPVGEERLERLCLAFEAEKPYLISLWRWPERFRPARIRR